MARRKRREPAYREANEQIMAWLKERGFDARLTSDCCPQQIEGTTPGGRQFYYRARYGHLTLLADATARDADELVARHLTGGRLEFALEKDGLEGGGFVDARTASVALAQLVEFERARKR